MAMPAAEFLLDVPFTGGLDDKSDPNVLEPPFLRRAENVVFAKDGGTERRTAMLALANTGLAGHRGNAIFERGGGAHVVTDDGVYGYDATAATWRATNARGLRPCQVKTDPAVRVENDNVMQPDSATVGGYVATVWMNTEAPAFTGGPTANTRCFVQVVEKATGVVVTPPTQLPAAMVGTPHVFGYQGVFIFIAFDASDHVRTAKMTPTGGVPTSTIDITGAAMKIFDVSQSDGNFPCVLAATTNQLNFYRLDNTGAVVVSKTGVATSVGTSIRGIGITYTAINSRFVAVYTDQGAGGIADAEVWIGHLDAALTTWTQTGSVHGNFSPRTGANGPSLAYADMAICQADATGAVFIAWSCMLGVATSGALAVVDPASVSALGLTAAVNHVVVEIDGFTKRAAVGLTRGYRIVGKAAPVTLTGKSYLPLGWIGGVRVDYNGTVATFSNRDSKKETAYPGMMLCESQIGQALDSSQPPVLVSTCILVAVARFNRDVAYSYILGSASRPSISQLWSADASSLNLAAPCERVAIRPLPSTTAWEANTTEFRFDVKPLRKVKANGSVYFDGGLPAAYDAQQSFEATVHQPPEQVSSFQAGNSPGGIGGWSAILGQPDSRWFAALAWTWEDANGDVHRSPLSPLITVTLKASGTDAHVAIAFTFTDPNALAAIENYGRNAVRVQLYVSANQGSSSPSADPTPYLSIDDIIGVDTRTGGGVGSAGYAIQYNGAGLVSIISTVPYPAGTSVLTPHYTLGGVLPSEPPHALRELTSWGNRLVGVDAENRRRAPYTKPFDDRVAAEWNGALGITFPSEGGDIVAFAVMDEKLIALRETALYYAVGDGADALGQGEQISVARIPSDLGCAERSSVIVLPDGVLFLSQRGWVLLDRSLQIRRPHTPDANVSQCSCALIVPGTTLVIFGTTFGYALPGNISMLGSTTLDYEAGQWSMWKPFSAFDACMVGATIYRLDTTGQNSTAAPDPSVPCVAVSQVGDSGNDPQGHFPLLVQTAWIRLSGMVGFQRVKRLLLRATNRMGLKITQYIDNDESAVASSSWTAAEVAALNKAQFEMHIPKQKCASVSFVIEQTDTWGGGMELDGLTLKGMRVPMPSKNLPAAARK